MKGLTSLLDDLKLSSDVDDYVILQNSKISQWPLLTKLITDRIEYEDRMKFELKKMEMLRQKYMEIIEKQEQILAELQTPENWLHAQ